METYDVIIVGGGPAGLRCAEVLSGSGKSVLLLEQRTDYGNKLCAGGLTLNDLRRLELPEEYIERSIRKTALHAAGSVHHNIAPEPFLFTVNRATLGAWQRKRIHGDNIKFLTGAKVSRIEHTTLVLTDGRRFGFHHLVGADGSRSVVRRHLQLPVEKRLMALQCSVPLNDPEPALEVHLRTEYFHAWYGWIFPHGNHMVVGCGCDPDVYPVSKLKKGFHRWVAELGIDIAGVRLNAWPIPFDYRGLSFGNIYLAGDAAGLASGLTGEGIYQALISGDEVANRILDPGYRSSAMEWILRYNRTLERAKQIYLKAGFLRGQAQELTVWLMKRHWFRRMLVRAFT
jgi:geranylgeranyl reductase